jgi:hypothetical protein
MSKIQRSQRELAKLSSSFPPALPGLFKKENSGLDGSDGAFHLLSNQPLIHSRSQQLAQHIVVGKRPRAARWAWARHLPFAFGRRVKDRFSNSALPITDLTDRFSNFAM